MSSTDTAYVHALMTTEHFELDSGMVAKLVKSREISVWLDAKKIPICCPNLWEEPQGPGHVLKYVFHDRPFKIDIITFTSAMSQTVNFFQTTVLTNDVTKEKQIMFMQRIETHQN